MQQATGDGRVLKHAKQDNRQERGPRHSTLGTQNPPRDCDNRPERDDGGAAGENGTTENLATGIADRFNKQQMGESRQALNIEAPGSSPRTYPAPRLATSTDSSALSGLNIDFDAEMKLDEEAQMIDDAVVAEGQEHFDADSVGGNAMGLKRKREVEEILEKNRPSAKQKIRDY